MNRLVYSIYTNHSFHFFRQLKLFKINYLCTGLLLNKAKTPVTFHLRTLKILLMDSLSTIPLSKPGGGVCN